MKIAVIVAMDKELQLLLPLLDKCHTITLADGTTAHEGIVGQNTVTAMKCGIGKVNAALRTMRMIDTQHPDLVINTGVAGGTGGGAGILDVVAGDKVAYHDVWCGPETIEGQAAECPVYFRPPEWVMALPALANVKKGLIASGDRFIASPAEVHAILANHPSALAVDMESAAIAHACHLAGVPFLSLRVVSDTPGDNDNNISQYEHFWDDAPAATFAVLHNLLSEI